MHRHCPVFFHDQQATIIPLTTLPPEKNHGHTHGHTKQYQYDIRTKRTARVKKNQSLIHSPCPLKHSTHHARTPFFFRLFSLLPVRSTAVTVRGSVRLHRIPLVYHPTTVDSATQTNDRPSPCRLVVCLFIFSFPNSNHPRIQTPSQSKSTPPNNQGIPSIVRSAKTNYITPSSVVPISCSSSSLKTRQADDRFNMHRAVPNNHCPFPSPSLRPSILLSHQNIKTLSIYPHNLKHRNQSGQEGRGACSVATRQAPLFCIVTTSAQRTIYSFPSYCPCARALTLLCCLSTLRTPKTFRYHDPNHDDPPHTSSPPPASSDRLKKHATQKLLLPGKKRKTQTQEKDQVATYRLHAEVQPSPNSIPSTLIDVGRLHRTHLHSVPFSSAHPSTRFFVRSKLNTAPVLLLLRGPVRAAVLIYSLLALIQHRRLRQSGQRTLLKSSASSPQPTRRAYQKS